MRNVLKFACQSIPQLRNSGMLGEGVVDCTVGAHIHIWSCGGIKKTSGTEYCDQGQHSAGIFTVHRLYSHSAGNIGNQRPEEGPSVMGRAVGEGLRNYYKAKIEELEIQARDKQHNLRRLEAQRNEINTRGRL